MKIDINYPQYTWILQLINCHKLVQRAYRSFTELSRIPGVIIKVNGHKVISYQIGTEYGILNDCYRAAGDLQHYSGSVEVNHDKNLSLRQAAALCNSCNKFTRGTCNCKSDCVSNRCSCKKTGISCSTHCHQSRSCKNKDDNKKK